MKNIIIQPAELSGEITIPPSKSLSHRAVICAGLAEGESCISNIDFSEDIEASCRAMTALGSVIQRDEKRLVIKHSKLINKGSIEIDCNESGSTLRFLIPVVLAMGREAIFTGKGRLVERPLKPYYDIFLEQGIEYENSKGNLPLTVQGRLSSGEFIIRENSSSQFISGLMFALPLLEGDSRILLNTKLESKPYVDLTIDMLKNFSIEVQNNSYEEFIIKGNQSYKPANLSIEGDYSQAAFWLTAGLLGGNIACRGLKEGSLQGDKTVLSIIEAMGGKIIVNNENIKVRPAKTQGIEIDASEIPDLVPILAVLGALSSGITRIYRAERLRIKESDRLKAISTELNKLGAEIIETGDGLIIHGKPSLKGGIVESWNDHRIAMALSIAATRCSEPVVLRNADCVNKSYPGFWKHYKELGGIVNEWGMGK